MKLEGVERAVLRSRAWRVTSTLLPVIFDLDVLPDRAEVLELGSGGGFNGERLLRRFPHWRLYATDFDPDMVELAERRLARWAARVRWDRVDATRLPYPDEAFDVVVSILVWHHVGDWRAATSEAIRVLRPGGEFVFADVFRNRGFGADNRSVGPSARYTRQELLEVTRSCGLRPRRIRSLSALACSLQAEKAV